MKNWQDKLMDLVEKELEECPKEKNCYMNDILQLVEKLLRSQRSRLRNECEKDILYKLTKL
jgi:hypothetical protein